MSGTCGTPGEILPELVLEKPDYKEAELDPSPNFGPRRMASSRFPDPALYRPCDRQRGDGCAEIAGNGGFSPLRRS